MTLALEIPSVSGTEGKTRTALMSLWRTRSEEWDRFGLIGKPTVVINQLLADLEVLWQSEDAEWLGSAAAAVRSGLDESTLRRLARSKQIVADKRGRKWWYLAGSLPAKAARITELKTFDAARAARKALGRPSITAIGDLHAKRQA